jgi:hypothetical protein
MCTWRRLGKATARGRREANGGALCGQYCDQRSHGETHQPSVKSPLHRKPQSKTIEHHQRVCVVECALLVKTWRLVKEETLTSHLLFMHMFPRLDLQIHFRKATFLRNTSSHQRLHSRLGPFIPVRSSSSRQYALTTHAQSGGAQVVLPFTVESRAFFPLKNSHQPAAMATSSQVITSCFLDIDIPKRTCWSMYEIRAQSRRTGPNVSQRTKPSSPNSTRSEPSSYNRRKQKCHP